MREISSLKAHPKLPNGSTFPSTATILINKHHIVGKRKDSLHPETSTIQQTPRSKRRDQMAMSRNVKNRKAKGGCSTRDTPHQDQVSSPLLRLNAEAGSNMYRLKVRSQPSTTPQRAPEPARVYPAPIHNRPSPYKPTLQKGGAFPKERGNALAGVGAAVWAKAYNYANSYVYDWEAISTRIAVAKKARRDGLIRDLAVERLIAKGVLSKDFVDASP